jgi:hypothetical protein
MFCQRAQTDVQVMRAYAAQAPARFCAIVRALLLKALACTSTQLNNWVLWSLAKASAAAAGVIASPNEPPVGSWLTFT